MSSVRATYWIVSSDLKLALQAFTRGQSVGNPSILTPYETREFLARWCARGKVVRKNEEGAVVTVTWPAKNFGTEGLNYLLSVLMGGQMDIDLLRECRLVELSCEPLKRHWGQPRWGVRGIKQHLGITNRALVGTIIKPKIGLRPKQLADVVKQLADGGTDFIKEDEILADQHWCPMKERLPLVEKALEGYRIIYTACVTADGSEAWVKARSAIKFGASAIHLNIWSGLGTYLDVWKHVPAPLFFQKSGDKVWTTGPYSIDYTVLCQLINAAGCDFAHVGMYGGYLAESVGELRKRITALGTTIPSFSCGMTPQLAEEIVARFGTDVMVTSGGWVHGQQEGVVSATQALRQAVESASVAVEPVHRRLVAGKLPPEHPSDADGRSGLQTASEGRGLATPLSAEGDGV